jgi:N-acetylglucosaminyl-diphospho-decaprenol L-rhamnosyltransferase
MSKRQHLKSRGKPSEKLPNDMDTHWGVPSDEAKANVSKLMQNAPESRRYAVIIVHYHRIDETKELLESIPGWDEPPQLVLVADNSAPHYDWSFTQHSPIPISVFPFKHNPGYGAAVNHLVAELDVGISQFLVLTHEVFLKADCSRLLLNSLHSAGTIAVTAPILVYRDKPQIIFSAGGTLSKRGVAKHHGMGRTIDTLDTSTQKFLADWADGACLLIRRDIFESLNGFDPRYFLYVEEIDYQYRASLVGAKSMIVFVAQAAQSPGNYPLFLKFRNHSWLSKKMAPHLSSWPWAFELIKDTVRWLTGRIGHSPLNAIRGLRASRKECQ